MAMKSASKKGTIIDSAAFIPATIITNEAAITKNFTAWDCSDIWFFILVTVVYVILNLNDKAL